MRQISADLFFFLCSLLQQCANFCFAIGKGIIQTKQVGERNLKYWDQTTAFQTKEHVFSGLFEWEKEAYQDINLSPKKIGIVGCGAGRDLIALSKMGHDVHGIDISSKCILTAKEFLRPLKMADKVNLSNAIDVNFNTDNFDVIIFSWFTYSYIAGEKDRIQSLKSMRKYISKSGSIEANFFRCRLIMFVTLIKSR